LIRTSFTTPITSKTTGVRMGKGKGAIDKYIQVINIFDCFFELKGISSLLAFKLLKKISYKLPVRVCLIDRKRNIYITR
jgi:large subunit ribosomal protein L16